VHIVNSQQFRELTGEEPPPTPVSAQTYAEHGLPWFELYDERRGDIPAAERLARVATVKDTDVTRGLSPGPEETSVDVDEAVIHKIHPEGRDPAS
jgi:hypothetical protein